MRLKSILVILTAVSAYPQAHESLVEPSTNVTSRLNAFATKFWKWRSVTQPITTDDLPRTAVIRPDNWAPNCSAQSLQAQQLEYEAFVAELRTLRRNGGYGLEFSRWPRDDQVDYFALTSALNRVFWEQHILRPAQRDPGYYVQQSAGAIWDALVRQPLKWQEERVRSQLLPRLLAAPHVLADGEANLRSAQVEAEPVAAFGALALDTLGWNATSKTTTLSQHLKASISALSAAASLDPGTASQLSAAATAAGAALTHFGAFVASASPHWATNASIGEDNYHWFLQHVSFINSTSDKLAHTGAAQLARAASMLEVEVRRNNAAGLPKHVPLYRSLEAQAKATALDSLKVKRFLSDLQLLKLPSWFAPSTGYGVHPIPPWLAPFDYSNLGEEDDFTSASESLEGVSMARYVPPPRAGLPFFLDAMARDARPVIVHEGLPGHFCQFSCSWRNPREARRHWLDSVANEGLAFYWEEVTLMAGLYDDQPRLRETMLEFMRLRAIRVAADVGLSVGSMSVAQATDYFATQVPMSREEAKGEVCARLQAPAQGLSYVIGKAQLFEFVQASKLRAQSLNSTLDLLEFHTSIEVNGNLPFVLQMHAAGLQTSLSLDFENLHSAFDGVGTRDRMAELQAAPELVRRLPGTPAGPSPLMLSGYERVAGVAGGTEERSLFWLLVHSSMHNASHDPGVPVVIWLQGGNGCSSMIGAFTENGPFYSPVQQQQSNATSGLLKNEHSLHHLAHVLYLDRPAGSGFSFSGAAPNVSWANDNQTALDGLAALRGILRKFPWLGGRQVWVAGESYAGHFTVQLATAIANAEPTLPAGTTLGGVICGNGVVDINQTNYAWFEAGYTHSLVDEEVWRGMQRECDFTKDLGVDGNGCPRGVSDTCAHLISRWMNQSGSNRNLLSLYDFYSDVCLTESTSPRGGGSALRSVVDACADVDTEAYLNLPAVRASLHVSAHAPERWHPCSQSVNDAYSCPDTLVSVAPLYQALLQDTRRRRRLLIYSGDVDGVVPTLATRRWIAAMQGKVKVQGWRLWLDSRGQIGGYTEQYSARGAAADAQLRSGELIFATVRGAGHMVPTYQPLRAFELFRSFLRDESLPG